ncbi:hypothetical protein BDZ91DRAFT_438894 [Kalaharituber pfeilii]|nr:hypothetical protein BDZ91DRAFT_438894 [Kalaharituber pfeilii]
MHVIYRYEELQRTQLRFQTPKMSRLRLYRPLHIRVGLLALSIVVVARASAWPAVVFNNLPKSNLEEQVWWLCAPWGLSGAIVRDGLYFEGGLFQIAYTETPSAVNLDNVTVTHRPNEFLLKIDASKTWVTSNVPITAYQKPGALTKEPTARSSLFTDGYTVYGAGGLPIATRGNFPASSQFIDGREVSSDKVTNLWGFKDEHREFEADNEDFRDFPRVVEGGYTSDIALGKGYSFGGVVRAGQADQEASYSPTRDVPHNESDALLNVTYEDIFAANSEVTQYRLGVKELMSLPPFSREIRPRVGNSMQLIPAADKGMVISVGGKAYKDGELVSIAWRDHI